VKTEKDIRARIAKANDIYRKLDMEEQTIDRKVKTRLYEALVLSTLQYGVKTRSTTSANTKRQEADSLTPQVAPLNRPMWGYAER